ncbi:AIP3-domain-containing protein [Dendrothele bispora CBS 962.96]|uniref:AIP3-domain-containing protein n=1 Tax=Dendrothele bispora (strain CBS 962.96) TaxID=1314807 RepID=A0A4S8KY64_DENBC|nr:AIP3-domain-containing protein [Dendrothele bispora CBS 962.96]
MSSSDATPGHHRNSSSQRRENASSSSGSRSGKNGTHPAVESAVTRLLVSIKQLLEALTQWSNLKVDESNVSDVYVRLGNDFNAAVAAFGAFNIDMNELLSVPDDLRNVLEQCLAEDANPENLELYLPTVRQIITNLLQGLRGKQSIYRRLVSDHKHRSGSDGSGHERTESRSSRSSRRERESSHRSQLSRSGMEERSERDGSARRSTASSSGRRRDIASSSSAPPIPENGPSSPRMPDGRIAEGGEYPNPYESPQRAPAFPVPSLPDSSAPPFPIPSLPSDSPPTPQTSSTSTSSDNTLVASQPAVPASIKRYSLVDKPISSPPTPSVVIEPSSPDPDTVQTNGDTVSPPGTPPIDASQTPAMANSLAALKKSDALERRASKRFSTYNISKMTGSTTRERSTRSQNRRSLAVGSALTPGELAALTEVDEEEGSSPTSSPTKLQRKGSGRSRSISRSNTPDARVNTPPVPPLPSTPSRTPEPLAMTPEPPGVSSRSVGSGDRSSTKMTVFLQLGREVKKVQIEPGLSVSSLRVLFVDKFSYNPGLENFPAIYIRDPSSGVQYELEDMDEVKDKCLLSLNIEPLDQIKQHIDSQISGLSRDIKELQTAVSSTNRQTPVFNFASPIAESAPAPNRPTDRQLQTVARRLSQFVSSNQSGATPLSPTAQAAYPLANVLQPQMTGASVASDYSNRVVTDLKTQFDEVQNLRRDLGIMRQLYTEFMKQTKESLGTLRSQTQSVKQLANANVGGARAFIDEGKQKLDVRTQNVLTEVEKLQDMVENIKDDVLKRHVTPKATQLKAVKKDMDTVAGELEGLKEHFKTIKPMWKKTWEEELQNIVEEQQFLTHQEEFLSDLLEDHKAVVEVYGHVEQVINLRGAGSGRRVNGRGFRPAPSEEGNIGMDGVLMEIRTAAVDPEKRMKAIEANQKARRQELANRSDDLQAELTDFVGSKKLRMTGGAEEVERVRQKRNDQTLKAMFTGNGSTEITPMSSSPSTP